MAKKLATSETAGAIARAINELSTSKGKIVPDKIQIVTVGANRVYFSIDNCPLQFTAVLISDEKQKKIVLGDTLAINGTK